VVVVVAHLHHRPAVALQDCQADLAVDLLLLRQLQELEHQGKDFLVVPEFLPAPIREAVVVQHQQVLHLAQVVVDTPGPSLEIHTQLAVAVQLAVPVHHPVVIPVGLVVVVVQEIVEYQVAALADLVAVPA
jgi:hypothetical protein